MPNLSIHLKDNSYLHQAIMQRHSLSLALCSEPVTLFGSWKIWPAVVLSLEHFGYSECSVLKTLWKTSRKLRCKSVMTGLTESCHINVRILFIKCISSSLLINKVKILKYIYRPSLLCGYLGSLM